MSRSLKVLTLYPDQMNIYADRGNILFLSRRCEWRGIGVEVTACGPGERFEPDRHDLIYIGGGQDRDQRLVAEDMIETKKASLEAAIETGAVVLAVCGGYQLLGRTWATDSGTHEGLALLDFVTTRPEGPRLIGPVAIEVESDGATMKVAGFENHGGRTFLGEGVRPWGRVVAGHGNNGRDGTEGVAYKNLIGTYLHGPLLPKNYRLADELIERALARGGRVDGLAPLDDALEESAHRSALRAAINGR